MRTQAARACERLNTKVNSSSGASAQALAEEMAVVVYDIPTAASECPRMRAWQLQSAVQASSVAFLHFAHELAVAADDCLCNSTHSCTHVGQARSR